MDIHLQLSSKSINNPLHLLPRPRRSKVIRRQVRNNTIRLISKLIHSRRIRRFPSRNTISNSLLLSNHINNLQILNLPCSSTISSLMPQLLQ